MVGVGHNKNRRFGAVKRKKKFCGIATWDRNSKRGNETTKTDKEILCEMGLEPQNTPSHQVLPPPNPGEENMECEVCAEPDKDLVDVNNVDLSTFSIEEDMHYDLSFEQGMDKDIQDIENHKLQISGDQDEKSNKQDAKVTIEGRRIVDMQYFFDQLLEISRHNFRFNCQLNHLKCVKEVRHALFSTFTMQCSMCGSKFQLNSSEKNAKIDVNHAAVAGTIMIGCGLTNFNELAATLDLPTFNFVQYQKCHNELHDWWRDTAESTMKDAAKDEAEMATETSSSGVSMIPVTADACWSKRSYRTNYSSLSGVGAIIGIKTGKVLHIGVKNKYCIICVRAKSKNKEAPKHQCTINHKGSSTSMEQAAIVEGFKKSEKDRNLIYSKLIADGDASTYKHILDSRPYNTVTVDKIECSNHLKRNYNGKLMGLKKDTSIPLEQRRLLNGDRLERLRLAVKGAVRFRKAENLPTADKINKLQKDILNSPLHVFGDHSNCERYYCTNERKLEPNYTPHVPILLQRLSASANALSKHAKSLLHDLNNNRAEQFNAMVAKYVGGKRINYALKNSYALRCYAAVVAFNTGAPIRTLFKKVTAKSPSIAVKRFEQTKRRQNSLKKVWKPKRRIDFDSEHADYGEVCQKPDMTPDEYESAKIEYVAHMAEKVTNREAIEKETQLQSDCALWHELRRNMITASNFGKVCKRKTTISSAPLVRTMLYKYSLEHVSAIIHGKSHESIALLQLAKQESITIKKCGLYIDDEFFFLGASPDGLYENGIIEIKCPKSAFGVSVDDAIDAKKVNFWKKVKGQIVLNTTHDWYYQVQGQLHITKKEVCMFGVWTGSEFPVKVATIKRDDDFWNAKMKNRLVDYYNKCFLPEIIDPRKYRSMELRACSY